MRYRLLPFLKLLQDWPASLLTWDILFLIPVPWVGPAPAVPILDSLGAPVAAVGVMGTTVQISEGNAHALVAELTRAAGRIAEGLRANTDEAAPVTA